VRVSGPRTRKIATEILGSLPAARQATVAIFAGAGGMTIDVGLAL
jgi:tRNA U34 5-carboxymethylaminomethyl modifying GTPase MnmE/TrmE